MIYLRVSFFIGLVIAIIALLIGFLLKDYNITLKITGIVSVSCIVICGILNGSFISGDRYRDNYISETKDDRNKKIKIVNNLLLVLMSNAIVSILLLMFI